jgi:hypothetical protein
MTNRVSVRDAITPPPVLRGPSDADHYRVKVGRYGDRWYTDPLPDCPIAEASDWQGPSWSIVKGAAGKDWSYVANKRNGYTDQHELHRIADLPGVGDRVAAFNHINKTGLAQAGGRGTIVHLWAEDFLAGRGPRIITDPILFSLKLPKAALDEATTYLEALAAFFDHYQPEVIAAEYVAIHRTLNGYGYGCTPDVVARILLRIEGDTFGIDWKSRSADSDHGAYPEEAAQIAAGARAEYMIITGPNGHPVRARIPNVDAGLIVSIKPDGCRVYPTDIELGWEHVQAMHAFWVARLTEKDAICKPWAPTPTNQGALCLTNSKTPSTGSTSKASTSSSEGSDETSPASEKNSPNSTTNTTNSAAPSTTSQNNSTDPDDFAFTAKVLADAILDWTPEMRQYLRDWWPADTPPPGQVRRGEATWTEPQIDAITLLCDLGDAPFWQPATPVTRT